MMRSELAICGLLLLAVGLVFGQTVHHDFIDLDDTALVSLNPHVTGGLTADALKWAFTHCHAGAYAPATWITHMLDCQLYGLNAGGHHLTNIILHAATVVLLFLVLRQMTGCLWPSAFVAAVFAVHPLQVQSVAWVVERKDVLSGLFFVLTLGAYTHYARQRSFRRYLIVVVLFVLGLMAKPMLVTLPFVLLLLDYWPLGRMTAATTTGPNSNGGGNATATLILEKLPLFAVAAVFCAVVICSYHAQAVDRIYPHFPLWWRIGNAPVSYVTYLGMFFWPVGLGIPYPRPSLDLSLWKVFGAVTVLVVVTLSTLAWRRKHPYLLVGWLWYLGMLVPVIGLLPMGMETMADRFMYLPHIGLAIALTWGVADASRSRYWPRSRAACGAVAILVLAVLTGCAWRQTSFWRDSEMLWTHTLACTPPNSVARHALGNTFLGRGQIGKAIEQYEAAISIDPDYAMAHYNLGVALASMGRLDEAIAQYQEAVHLRPDDAVAHNNLGNALLIRGQIEKGLSHCQEALRIDPELAEAHYNVGNVHYFRGHVDEAIAEYRKALQINPHYEDAQQCLNSALDVQKKKATTRPR